MSPKMPMIYANVVLSVLHSEFSFSKREHIDATIIRRLKTKNAGPYSQSWTDMLRQFKDEVQAAIGLQPGAAAAKHEQSVYFLGRHGKYGDYQDFDIPKMTADLIERYPQIPKQAVKSFVRYAVGTYYLL